MNTKSDYFNFSIEFLKEDNEILDCVVSEDYIESIKELSTCDIRYENLLENIKGTDIEKEILSNPEICWHRDNKNNKIFTFMKPSNNDFEMSINLALVEGVSNFYIESYVGSFLYDLGYRLDPKIPAGFIEGIYHGIHGLAGVIKYCEVENSSVKKVFENIMKLEDIVLNGKEFYSDLGICQYSLDVSKSLYLPNYHESYFVSKDSEIVVSSDGMIERISNDSYIEYN